MKKILFWSIFSALPMLTAATSARGETVACSLSLVMPSYSPLADQAPSARTVKDLKKLMGLVCPQGCGRVDLFQNATVPNALAVNSASGSSRIEYSPAFLEKVRELFGADARMGILAHELGHHIDQNGVPVVWINPAWSGEQRADAWAGCALARSGMKTQGLKDALQAVAASQPTKTEPNWSQRWGALQAGYDGCAGVEGTKLTKFEGMKLAKMDPNGRALPAGGCTTSAECKLGRQCVEGRCENRSAAWAACGKDVDCPDGQICTAVGKCDNPAGSGQLVSAAVTALVAKAEPRACLQQCGVERKECRVGAMKSLNECLHKVTADPAYLDCHCPSWPSTKPACHQVCEEAFDRADQCESEYAPGKDACVAEAPTCKNCR